MMKNVVLLDRGTHWEVIGDYSGSPRHAMLSEAKWKVEYATDPAYAEMRKSQTGAMAACAPKGAGKWKKDWSGPYVSK